MKGIIKLYKNSTFLSNTSQIIAFSKDISMYMTRWEVVTFTHDINVFTILTPAKEQLRTGYVG